MGYFLFLFLLPLFQSEDSLVDLLQNLADMDITFQALKVNFAFKRLFSREGIFC